MTQKGNILTMDTTDWERLTKNMQIRVAGTDSKTITMTCRANRDSIGKMPAGTDQRASFLFPLPLRGRL